MKNLTSMSTERHKERGKKSRTKKVLDEMMTENGPNLAKDIRL